MVLGGARLLVLVVVTVLNPLLYLLAWATSLVYRDLVADHGDSQRSKKKKKKKKNGAAFAGSPGSWLFGRGGCRQVVWSVVQPVSMSWFQGQSRGSRSLRRRPVRTMRPATARIRNRSRLGSHRRAGSVGWKASVWVQASRSAARATTSSQSRFFVVVVEGQVPQPGVLEVADAVLTTGALPVADLEHWQSPAGAAGCWWRSR